MKITINIDGTDYKGNVEPITSCESKVESTKTGFERVSPCNIYYKVLHNNPSVLRENKHGFADDVTVASITFEKGNYFSDLNLAEDYIRAISLFLKLSRWQAEHDEQPDLKSGFYYDVKKNHAPLLLEQANGLHFRAAMQRL
ncbi:MAG: hypothetical protein NC299_16785 [Lachnospiraceae bacterium]|nr:hypothetical protein [Ruminococcus sp.]MCM1276991.1 hypothetical protein [Lachnospiraceae bacterium]